MSISLRSPRMATWTSHILSHFLDGVRKRDIRQISLDFALLTECHVSYHSSNSILIIISKYQKSVIEGSRLSAFNRNWDIPGNNAGRYYHRDLQRELKENKGWKRDKMGYKIIAIVVVIYSTVQAKD